MSIVVWFSVLNLCFLFLSQVNPELKEHFEGKGFHFVGQDVEGERMEVIELDGKSESQASCVWVDKRLALWLLVRFAHAFLPRPHMNYSTVSFSAGFPDHPYFVGVQYHPEFTSRPIKPSPPYFGLLLASAGKLQSYLQKGCRLSPR